MNKTIILILLFLPLSVFAQTKERWDVKTCTDDFTPPTHIHKATVQELEMLHLIRVGNSTPRLNREKKIIELTGTITKISKEADGDIHVEISDGTCKDSSVATEFVNPKDEIAHQSPLIDDFNVVRSFILAKKVGDNITVIGPLFQDKYHNPSLHRIRNMLEVHPVLKAY